MAENKDSAMDSLMKAMGNFSPTPTVKLGDYTPEYVHAGYLTNLIQTDKLRNTIAKACLILKKFNYDSIAVSGVSGLLIGPALCQSLNKTLIVVRKDCEFKGDNDRTHSFNHVEGDRACRRYIIVDDIVDSGNTCRRIVRKIDNWMGESEHPHEAKCLGALAVNSACNSYMSRTDDELADLKLTTRFMDGEEDE